MPERTLGDLCVMSRTIEASWSARHAVAKSSRSLGRLFACVACTYFVAVHVTFVFGPAVRSSPRSRTRQQMKAASNSPFNFEFINFEGMDRPEGEGMQKVYKVVDINKLAEAGVIVVEEQSYDFSDKETFPYQVDLWIAELLQGYGAQSFKELGEKFDNFRPDVVLYDVNSTIIDLMKFELLPEDAFPIKCVITLPRKEKQKYRKVQGGVKVNGDAAEEKSVAPEAQFVGFALAFLVLTFSLIGSVYYGIGGGAESNIPQLEQNMDRVGKS